MADSKELNEFTEQAHVGQVQDHTTHGPSPCRPCDRPSWSYGEEGPTKHECEAWFLAVDVDGLQAELMALGVVQDFARGLFARKVFENDALEGGARVRPRDEATRSTHAERVNA